MPGTCLLGQFLFVLMTASFCDADVGNGSKQYNHLVLHQACEQMDATTMSRLITDGAWKLAQTEAGIAWVYVDHTGQLIYQNAARVNPLLCPTAAEAMACL
ncbi:hypothetical protein LOK49_Contig336G00001, partial [Camellia lanceoleosa]